MVSLCSLLLSLAGVNDEEWYIFLLHFVCWGCQDRYSFRKLCCHKKMQLASAVVMVCGDFLLLAAANVMFALSLHASLTCMAPVHAGKLQRATPRRYLSHFADKFPSGHAVLANA